MSSTLTFAPREIKKEPSTDKVKALYAEYLSAPLFIDCEYIKLYTEKHKEVSFWEEQERRAECHAYALENLTPVIRDNEIIAGAKTRYVRGAIPYTNYAAGYILRELNREVQEAQDAVTDLGSGGGIAKVHSIAESGEFEVFCHKFLISHSDKEALHENALYWQDKCMQAEGDILWKNHYSHASWIEKGWESVLYTAPHDPAPEGRFVIDFDVILKEGLENLIERIRAGIARLMRHPGSIDGISKIHFYRAAIRVLEATIRWAKNYGNLALEKSKQEKDPVRKSELETMARHCQSFGKIPQSFREAVQHFWFAYIAGHIEGAHLGYSVGRFDRYMYSFYKKSIDEGSITREEALELLEALRIKHTEIEYVASFSWEGLGSGNLFQNLMLGGYTEDGMPADNELSVLTVEAAIHTPTTQPTLSIWWTPGLSEEFLLKAVECVKTGVGFPAWFNADVYIKHELIKNPQLGIEFIRKYASMGGCTEPVLEGCSYGVVQPGFINHMKVFEIALHGGKDPRTGIIFEERALPDTYETLKTEYLYFLEKTIRYWQEYWNIVMEAHARTVPLIFCSAVMKDCVGRGLNMDRGGLLNNSTPTTLSSGLVNVANALTAVRELTETGKYSFSDMKKALTSDWQGFERMHKDFRNAPKWGNDEASVDNIMKDLWGKYCGFVEKGENYLGKQYDPSMLAISTYTPFGKVCLATPDGRKSGESLADGVTSPHPGTDKSGPTAVLRSVQKIDHTRIRGGLHNMKFHPSALTGTEGSLKLLQLIKTYFETQTAFQIQFNVVDSNMLKDAQTQPEKYRDLIVRVAGFSAFFVELQKSVQDQVIERTEQGL
jgi:formate C-acetyltransferase/4-hydroxyphenylacetate decarboxylase large subunit